MRRVFLVVNILIAVTDYEGMARAEAVEEVCLRREHLTPNPFP